MIRKSPCLPCWDGGTIAHPPRLNYTVNDEVEQQPTTLYQSYCLSMESPVQTDADQAFTIESHPPEYVEMQLDLSV